MKPEDKLKKKNLNKNNPKHQIVSEPKKLERHDFATKFSHKRVLTAIAILIPIVAVVNYFYIHIAYSINFPFFDDFEAILDFLNKYLLHPKFVDRVVLLFSQHSEHRLVFDRSVALLEYYVFGKVDFESFLIIGNASLIVTLLFLYKSFVCKHGEIHIIFLAPIALILFNLRCFETSFWPMAALQNLWVVCFVLLALYFLFQENKSALFLSILFGWMATFTSANGMMAFVAGAFGLFINKALFKKEKLIWFAFGLLVMAIYFYHYVKPAYHPEIIKPLMQNPMGFLGYVFAFLGGVFTENSKYAILIGITLVLFVGFITFKKYYKSNPIIYSYIIFLLITSILAALTRFGFGLEQALSSKYTITSALLVVCCYIAFVSLVYKRINVLYLTIFTGLAFLFNYNTQNKYLPFKKDLKQQFDHNLDLVRQQKFSEFDFGWPPMDGRKSLPKKILKTADSLGYYPFKFLEDSVLMGRIPTRLDKQLIMNFDKVQQIQGTNSVFISGWSFLKNTNADSTICFICFKNSHGSPIKYLMCEKVLRKDITEKFKDDKTDYDLSGYQTVLNLMFLPPETYTIYVLLVDVNYRYKVEFNTKQSIQMK